MESARAFLTHEREVLEAVTRARGQAAGARRSSAGDPTQTSALKALAEADAGLTGALGRLTAVVESCPALKADRTVSELLEELRSAENQIAFARRSYNDAAASFNQARELFPAVLLAGLFGFQPAELWALEDPVEAEPARFSLAPTGTASGPTPGGPPVA